jgi:hypothetical protein
MVSGTRHVARSVSSAFGLRNESSHSAVMEVSTIQNFVTAIFECHTLLRVSPFLKAPIQSSVVRGWIMETEQPIQTTVHTTLPRGGLSSNFYLLLDLVVIRIPV